MGSIACVVGPFALKRGLLFSPNEPPIAYTPALLALVYCFKRRHLRGGFERRADLLLSVMFIGKQDKDFEVLGSFIFLLITTRNHHWEIIPLERRKE
ncbi:hypothetical protein RF091_30690 [Serratia marcescens]|uniref:Uncharacterized protein n=1 Tax=Serratia marcescens TaxID=615 RepID=A0ABD5BT17_SERMA|nr:hypothetical protein [Serratia marcescens]